MILSAKAKRHVIEALRDLAKRPHWPSNCGTVCLCGPCHARAALAEIDPMWRSP